MLGFFQEAEIYMYHTLLLKYISGYGLLISHLH